MIRGVFFLHSVSIFLLTYFLQRRALEHHKDLFDGAGLCACPSSVPKVRFATRSRQTLDVPTILSAKFWR
ncbi:hypothetical protein EDC27_3149 [Desulfosoma caldarium]|uniref:Uncharacterized protein n=1 Tax=Desulfosoma caldarium TaxID=610254 RepID=A0A3N1UDX8_9BACT|nr:hypothetical protein EDC27_3149 [Desulfosoma caldarium]